MKNIIIGRSNLSVTIFIPVDCSNNCNFCTSKNEYCEQEYNLKKVIKSIKKLNKNEDIKSYVITGGEPFADLKVLNKILKAIEFGKDVYVNTTLPTNKYTEEELITFINQSRISAINLSRHTSNIEKDKLMFSDYIASDNILNKINKPIKINCFVTNNTDLLAVINRWYKYKNVYLTFRADYRRITKETLRKLDDEIALKILNIKNVKHLYHGGCDVCFDMTFKYADDFIFSYHRGLEHSSISFGDNYVVINDIIIWINGKCYYDWDKCKKTQLKIKNGNIFIKNIEE